jgi:hypothetical protein
MSCTNCKKWSDFGLPADEPACAPGYTRTSAPTPPSHENLPAPVIMQTSPYPPPTAVQVPSVHPDDMKAMTSLMTKVVALSQQVDVLKREVGEVKAGLKRFADDDSPSLLASKRIAE